MGGGGGQDVILVLHTSFLEEKNMFLGTSEHKSEKNNTNFGGKTFGLLC